MAGKDYTTKIKIEGDSKGAESAISGAGRALSGFGQSALRISRRIGQALSVFSRLTWIVQSFQLLIDGFKKLNQWIHSSETAARELADTMERTAITAQSALNADAYKKLNKELDEANRLERQRNDILSQRKAIGRDLEDANLAFAKEREIAALDPESKDYSADKAAIERKYTLKGAEATMRRSIEDNRDEVSGLYREADRLDRQANQKEVAYKRQNAIVERGVERAFRLDREAKAIDDDDEEEKKAAQDKLKEAEQQWRADLSAAQKIKDSMDALRKEAEALRAKAANLQGGVAARRNFEAAPAETKPSPAPSPAPTPAPAPEPAQPRADTEPAPAATKPSPAPTPAPAPEPAPAATKPTPTPSPSPTPSPAPTPEPAQPRADNQAEMPGDVVARINYEAARLRADNQARAAAAAEAARLQATDKEQRQDVEKFLGALEAKATDRAWDKEYDEADSTRKRTMLRDKEATAAADLQTLRTQLEEEMAKDVKDRDSRRIADLKSGISDAQDRVYSAQDEAGRLAKEEVKDRNSLMGAMVSAAAPSGNRLTAMGLGAGSGVDRLQTQMADSLKHLVALSQQQISELRGIKEESLVATYGD